MPSENGSSGGQWARKEGGEGMRSVTLCQWSQGYIPADCPRVYVVKVFNIPMFVLRNNVIKGGGCCQLLSLLLCIGCLLAVEAPHVVVVLLGQADEKTGGARALRGEAAAGGRRRPA